MDAVVTLLILAGCCAVAISFSPIGKAIAGRIRGRADTQGSDPALLDELDEQRSRLAAMEERLDFAERALTSGPDAPRTKNDARV